MVYNRAHVIFCARLVSGANLFLSSAAMGLVSLYWYAFSETTTLYRNQFECDVFKEKTP